MKLLKKSRKLKKVSFKKKRDGSKSRSPTKKSRKHRRSLKKTSDCRMNIILDIDETLGHNIKPALWDKIPEEDKAKYKYVYFEGEKKHFVLRPHLKKFIDFLYNNNFNVGIWTVGSREYAIWVANKILIDGHKDRHVKPVLWATHETFGSNISEHNYGKDLKYLWIDPEYDDEMDPNNLEEDDEIYDRYEEDKDHPIMMHNFYPCNTILIDDNQANTTNKRNHMNSIHINGFSLFGHKKNQAYTPHYDDTTLLDIIEVLKKVKKQINKHECNTEYFATCMYPKIGKNGRVFDTGDIFGKYYRSHSTGGRLPHVCLGNDEHEGVWYR